MKKILGIPPILIAVVMLGLLVKVEVDSVMGMMSKGFSPMALLGMGFKFLFFIVLFGSFLKLGLGLLSPSRFGSAALAREDLKRIYAEEISGRPLTEPTLPTDVPYPTYTDLQLSNIYDRIKPEEVPLRFEHLLWEIKTRIEPELSK